MGTVVVTGVGGSLGRKVAERLAALPGDLRVIGVDSNEVAGLPESVERHLIDLADAEPGSQARLDAVVADADAVIHLAWKTPVEGAKARTDSAASVNHAALERVLEAMAQAGTSGLVYVSSATVYGAWPDNPVPLSEEAPLRPNPELAFAVGKADAERFVADWAEDHPSVAVTVLRPAAVVGSTTQPLYRALVGTDVPRWEDRARSVQFLHVDDLAAAVVLAWRQRWRGTFNVAPDSGTRDDTARALAGGVARVRLPWRVATLVGSWGWGLARSGAPRAARAYGTYPWVIAPDRIKAAGWVPRYSSEEALVATDPKMHWDDLPPGKRQNYTTLALFAALGAVAAGAVSGAAVLLRRRARRRPA